jgi:MoaA/NifB/PqqE/SkfB family radical SAM enzyme
MSHSKIACSLLYQLMKAKFITHRAPVFVSLVLNERCNLRCKYCYANLENRFDSKLGEGGFTKNEVFAMVDELYGMGTRLIFLLGGEPLLHDDIGEIVDHIVARGIMLHVITNGTLIKRKFNEINKAHVVCVSLDGPREFNDKYRGAGTYSVIMDNVRFAIEKRLPIRIHAVLTKGSIAILPEFVRLCQEEKVVLTYSPANYLGKTDFEDFKMSDDEYRTFWTHLIKMKKAGAPIGNSLFALRKVLDWPIAYHSFITANQAKSLKYRPVACASGRTYCAIDSSGIMFNCINKGLTNGLNIRDVGIRKAWDHLPELRKDCVSCATLNTVETSVYMGLSPHAWKDALSYTKKFSTTEER